MRVFNTVLRTMFVGAALLAGTAAGASYWNLFNEEGEGSASAQFAIYATLDDMLTDTNRLDVTTPDTLGAGSNIVGAGSTGFLYWNLFNEEGESGASAQYVTYNTLYDMTHDIDRTGVFTPNGSAAGSNIVGTGSDGSTYWSLFNEEGESDASAQYVTYSSFADMLADTNRVGVFTPDTFAAGSNIVDGSSDGSSFWNLFNEEGESAASAQFATYGSLADMLADTNRLGVFTPNTLAAGSNIAGSGSDSFPASPVPEPAAWAMLTLGFGLVGRALRRRGVASVSA